MSNPVFDEARDIAGGSAWAYLATCRGTQPTVRPVHPLWDDGVVWIATSTDSPKMRHVGANAQVELFWHLTDALRHLTVTGTAECVTDSGEKQRLWDLFDYDLAAYWPEGPDSPTYGLMKVTPTRVECWSLPEMGSGTPGRVWRAPAHV